MMKAKCPNCGIPYKLPDDAIGRKVICQSCKAVFTAGMSPEEHAAIAALDEMTESSSRSERFPKGEIPQYASTDEHAKKICPECGVPNHPSAVFCRQCKYRIQPITDELVVAYRDDPKTRTGMFSFVAALLVFVTFAAGLGIGLNIHPPDQHELEKGFELGRQKGYSIGFGDGERAGKQAGFEAGLKELRPELTDAKRQLNRAIKERRPLIQEARDAGYDAGEQEGRREGRLEAQREFDMELVAMSAEHGKRMAEMREEHKRELITAKKNGFDEGQLAAGYQTGYDKGIEEGIRRGRREVELKALQEVEAAQRRGYDEGFAAGETTGFEKGRREGKSVGERMGKKQGYKIGWEDGYDKARRDCKDG